MLNVEGAPGRGVSERVMADRWFLCTVNGSLKAREAGRSYGLKLTLDTKQDDYLRSMDQYYGAGFRVMTYILTLK